MQHQPADINRINRCILVAVFNKSNHRVSTGLWGPRQMLVVFWELAGNKEVSGEDDQSAVRKGTRV